MSVTVRDIAEKIASTPEGVPSAMERVRHWTREGHLKMVGDPNPGTGRKRYYDDKAQTFAYVLNAMANAGIEVSKARTLIKADAIKGILDTVWQIRDTILSDKSTNYYIMILYGPEYGPKGFALLAPMQGTLMNYAPVDEKAEMAVVINLSKIVKA